MCSKRCFLYCFVLVLVISNLIPNNTGQFLLAKTGEGAKSDAPNSSATNPELIIDFQDKKMIVKLAGVVMREYPFVAGDDSGDTVTSKREIIVDTVNNDFITSIHLIAAAETIPQRELDIIIEETGLSMERVQRYAPQQLILITNNSVRISIKSDCTNAKTYLFESVSDWIRRLWYAFLFRKSVDISISADDALSLWGVSREKMPVSIIW